LLFEKKDFTKMFNTLCCPGFATGSKQKGLAQKEKYPFSSLVIPLLISLKRRLWKYGVNGN